MQIVKKSAGLVVLLLAFGWFLCLPARAQDTPRYRVDPAWPKELPNNWVNGRIESVVVDKSDHIWTLHLSRSVSRDELGAVQKPPLSQCCALAPSVLEFDTEGNVLSSWGGPGHVPDWPAAEQGMWVDKTGNVWITGAWYSGQFVRRPEDDLNIPIGLEKLPWDRHALKFSKDGKLLLEIGHPSKDALDNRNTRLLGGPSAIQVDESANEVYFADGSLNRRIVVYDSETGEFKRGWGAYGMPLSQIDNAFKPHECGPCLERESRTAGNYDPSAPPFKQFRGPLVGLRLSVDGLLYVGDRQDNRIQVFTKRGKFVKDFVIAPKTLGEGSVAGLTLSRDREQKYLLVADGSNNVVWVLNRNDGTVVTKFGHKGHNAGEFSNVQTLDLDSHGNIYTGEVKYNNRLQKFLLQ